MSEVFGLDASQHWELGQLVQERRRIRRSAPDPGRPPIYPGAIRVLCLGDDPPEYSPREPRDVAVFRWNPDGAQTTVEFSGLSLEGQLDVTVGEYSATVDCRVTTQALRDALGIPLADCRVTVFPALWEFDFSDGRLAGNPPAVTVTPHEPPEGSDEPVFDGGIEITAEAWVSETNDGDGFVTTQARDWIPHLTGAIRSGAVGAALLCHAAGWLVLAWQCREWSWAED